MSSIFDYIDYFKDVRVEDACKWEGGNKRADGVFTMGYPVYDQRVKDFIETVYETGYLDFGYSNTIERHSVDLNVDRVGEIIESADFALTKAILTHYVRGERFVDGHWASAIKHKIFYQLLVRLKKLEN